jgi:multidrug efflux pump subunit AcrA (membrane-fusion protein)
MPDTAQDNEPYLELHEVEGMSTEHIDSQVQRAQEQLLQLKRQQDLIEKQKRELEELSKRQEQLQHGKAEMLEKFTRSLVVLERETYDTEKRVENLKAIRESFLQHLDILESINPKAWEGADLNRELTKALSAVDDARAEYSRCRSKLNAESGEELLNADAQFQMAEAGQTDKGFGYWFKSGFAFTLPLLILGIIILLVLLSRQTTP